VTVGDVLEGLRDYVLAPFSPVDRQTIEMPTHYRRTYLHSDRPRLDYVVRECSLLEASEPNSA
jgi:hypothetical protein